MYPLCYNLKNIERYYEICQGYIKATYVSESQAYVNGRKYHNEKRKKIKNVLKRGQKIDVLMCFLVL